MRSFWLFRLLNPAVLHIYPVGTARLHCTTGTRQWIVEGGQSLTLTRTSDPVRICGPAGESVSCVLEIPNVIRRPYSGVFTVQGHGESVLPIVSMGCETATGSIVAAELPVSIAPIEALRAQAVVSRSVLCATRTPRHDCADFCDTTHCQFLRSPAMPDSTGALATRTTGGIALYQRGRRMPALYSAACGGQTESGFDGAFEYASVPCEVCRSARNVRRGHGWGLCQEGAMGLARLGWRWREILAKYYPNATPLFV